MQVKLEQVFYGRGQFGYGVLAASPNGKAFSDAVESLCESIGSPDAFLTWKPFLVNRRFGDYCLMCRVQPGESDSCGRPTILYHVLIGLASEMVAAGLDAFVLQEAGFFRKDVVEHHESVSVEGRSQKRLEKRPFDIQFPAVVSVAGPEHDLIRRLLGADSVCRSWATFAFHPMPGFDLYALNDHTSLPTGVACYDSNGKLLSVPQSANQTGKKQAPISKKSPLLGASLAVNAILIVACVVLCFCHSSPQCIADRDNADGPQNIADKTLLRQIEELKAANEQLIATNDLLVALGKGLENQREQKGSPDLRLVSREAVMSELKEKFESQYHGKKQRAMENANFSKKDCEMYNPYIRFVNEMILEFSSSKK